MTKLPPFVPYPAANWREHLNKDERNSLLEAWISLGQAWLELADEQFVDQVRKDASVVTFITTFTKETALSKAGNISHTFHTTSLLRIVFQLTLRIAVLPTAPAICGLHHLQHFAIAFPSKHARRLVSRILQQDASANINNEVSSLKKFLIPELDGGIKGNLQLVESELIKLNPLLHISPEICALSLAGSDFLDGLVVCFRVMNPPLRMAILTTTYLAMLGLSDQASPKWAMLNDQLYALQVAAEEHKTGPLNVNDSLVPELVTNTPFLKVILQRAETAGAVPDNLRKRLNVLQGFKKGTMVRPKKLVRRKVHKGKAKEASNHADEEMHIHMMSKITQVQDLLPELGTGFVAQCLDEYGDDVEQVVANLLAETLPSHLAVADRSAMLASAGAEFGSPDLAPKATPELPPTRRNIYDDDEFDRLEIDDSKLSYGKDPTKDADQLLQERSTAPNKAAILSALASFDSDDDERDDTYDAADVGGVVDSTNQEADGVTDGMEELLFRVYQMDPGVFARTSDARKKNNRTQLRDETGMTDEAVEGWAIMLTRNPQQRRRLEAKYAFSGQQAHLERTAWKASPAGSGAEDSEGNLHGSMGHRGIGRGRGRGRGVGRGRGGSVAGPTGEKGTETARKNKEANKGSRANHNRREGRARKMARAGFPG